MNIGGRILKRLEELHWERRELLDRVPDLTPQALHNLIKRDSIRSEWDTKIADALGVSVLWLVYGESTEYAAAPQTTSLIAGESTPNVLQLPTPQHPSIKEVVQIMNSIDDLGKGMILMAARSVSKERVGETNKPVSST